MSRAPSMSSPSCLGAPSQDSTASTAEVAAGTSAGAAPAKKSTPAIMSGLNMELKPARWKGFCRGTRSSMKTTSSVSPPRAWKLASMSPSLTTPGRLCTARLTSSREPGLASMSRRVSS